MTFRKRGISCNGVIYDVLSKHPNKQFIIPEVRNLVAEVSSGRNYESIKRGLAEMTNEKQSQFPCMRRFDRGVYGFVDSSQNLFDINNQTTASKEIHIIINH